MVAKLIHDDRKAIDSWIRSQQRYMRLEAEKIDRTPSTLLSRPDRIRKMRLVAPVAVLPERVVDGVTGFVRGDDASFAEAALALANDDQLWRRQHEAALELQQGLSWSEVAERFEQALLSDRIALRDDPAAASR